MNRDSVNIAKTDYDKNLSRIPELIGKHPGIKAPLKIYRPNPLQFTKPASGSRVSGIIEVELKIREGNEELAKNLKKMVLTIDDTRFEFNKPPYTVHFDTSHAQYRLIKLKAEAIGNNTEQEESVLTSFYINVIAENGALDKSKPLLLFAGVLEPNIEHAREFWTPDMYLAAYTYSENMMNHLIHYGFVPDFLKEVDQFTVLIDPTQLNEGLEEYTPIKLVDILGRETGPGCEGKTYTEMISSAHWIETTKTEMGTVLRGYHIPEMGLPNGLPDSFEVFAARVIRYYWKFDPLGGVRAWEQAQMLCKDIVSDLRNKGYNFAWDIYSTLIGKKPFYLKEIIKKHIIEKKITSIIVSNFTTDISDFDDTKGIWEDVQEAIDLAEKETGNKLPLSMVYTTEGEIRGAHPNFAESAFRVSKNEIEMSGITADKKVGIILGEHGYPPGIGEEDILGVNMERVRQNIRRVYDREIPQLRSGVTEYHFGMNGYNNNPDSWQMSSMEWMIDYLHRGFDVIIIQPCFFLNETFELFEDLRNEIFEVDGIDYEYEFSGGHAINNNYRSDFNFRGARIIITGSLLGRYKKDGHFPLIKEAYKLYKDCSVDALTRTLDSL